MNLPIKRLSLGKCQAALWKKEFEGKPSYSVSFQKSYKGQDGQWKNSNFFTLPDLRDLYILVGHITNNQVKEYKNESKPKPKPAEIVKEAFPDNDVGFDDVDDIEF